MLQFGHVTNADHYLILNYAGLLQVNATNAILDQTT